MILLEPIAIGGVTLPNRVVMAPMTTRLADTQGFVTPELVAHYEARAAGGVGLVTVELCSPTRAGAHRRGEVGIYDDQFIDGLASLVDRLHGHGARCSIQVGHAGAHARPDVTGAPAIAPSDVPHVVREGDSARVVPRPMNLDDMDELVQAYSVAVARVRAAGFDLVELQGGHDYLLFQFLSPLDNHRTDEYGDGLINRARFPLRVVRACRDSAGEMPLSFRMSADEFASGGFTIGDAEQLAPMLAAAGVAMISVSAGSARSAPIPSLITTPMAYPQGLFVPLAERIRKSVEIPVAVAGRLHDPLLAESVLREGQADLVVLGRALLADPRWVEHVRTGGADRIRPCIACNTCVEHLRDGGPIGCLVNPSVGRETATIPADPAFGAGRTALVLGGGPAGLTAAAHLAADGFGVELWERSSRLGGRLTSIHMAPRFQTVETAPEPFQALVSYLSNEARRAGVSLSLRKRSSPAQIMERRPDLVVVATGAVYLVPGLLRLLKVPSVRWLAGLPRLHKLFFKLLRTPHTRLPGRLRAGGVPVRIVGDRSGSRGVAAAIRGAHSAVQELRHRGPRAR
jgi:2,4-dienoyl-CoA reductase-like NADH-dependent reductase (Old Yellow Enzyme family)